MGRLNLISVVQLLNRIKYHQERRKVLMTRGGGQRGLTGLIYMTKSNSYEEVVKSVGPCAAPLASRFLRL